MTTQSDEEILRSFVIRVNAWQDESEALGRVVLDARRYRSRRAHELDMDGGSVAKYDYWADELIVAQEKTR